MNQLYTRRGETQINKNAVIKKAHSRVLLSRISTTFNSQNGGDPRQHSSGMTLNLMSGSRLAYKDEGFTQNAVCRSGVNPTIPSPLRERVPARAGEGVPLIIHKQIRCVTFPLIRPTATFPLMGKARFPGPQHTFPGSLAAPVGLTPNLQQLRYPVLGEVLTALQVWGKKTAGVMWRWAGYMQFRREVVTP